MRGTRYLQRIGVVAAVAGALLIAGIAPADAAAIEDETRFVEMINADREAAGAGPLVVLPELVEKARTHAGRMLAEGEIFHSDDLGEGLDGWYLLGENVGRGGNIETLHQAFMDSPGHRRNVLNPDYDAVGVGVVWDGSVPYVVEVFMDSIEELQVQFSPPFADDDGSVHETDIITLYEMGITKGCETARYCPDRDVTRGEMASMLVRAFGLPASADDPFADDDSSVHESSIAALAASGVTKGCAPGRFCPDRPVTRGEMATFLTRILDLGPAPSAGFADTASNVHASSIDSLAAAGITRGCTDSSFCPFDHVTRAQLASFLARWIDDVADRGSGTALLGDAELPFVDVHPDDVHAGPIARLTAAGVITGRTATTFEPNAAVTRAQTAALIGRTLEYVTGEGLPRGRDTFTDDNDTTHEPVIDRLAATGVVTGTGDWRFRPSASVTRGAVASFVMRAAAMLVEQDVVGVPDDPLITADEGGVDEVADPDEEPDEEDDTDDADGEPDEAETGAGVP